VEAIERDDLNMISRAFNAVSNTIEDIGGLIGYGVLILLGVAMFVALIILVVTLVLRAVSIGPS
jgi:hypothetical protein